MALGSCYGLLKCVVMFINMVFLVTGLAITALTIWLLTDPNVFIGITQEEASYTSGIYVLLGVGFLILILGILGCCGAYKESQGLLISFFAILLIVVVAEVAGGAWAFTNKEKLRELVRVNVKATVQEEYGVQDSRTAIFNTMQKELHCCGADGPTDWAVSKFNENADKIDLAVSSTARRYLIPASCCAASEEDSQCKAALNPEQGAPIPAIVYKEGCIEKLYTYLYEYAPLLIGIGITVGLFEILALILTLILFCAVRFVDLYKA